jgi:hypothetical protein
MESIDIPQMNWTYGNDGDCRSQYQGDPRIFISKSRTKIPEILLDMDSLHQTS